jgi:hypothetical protein
MACGYSLSSVILELAVRAGMDPRMINTSRLEGNVRGFAVLNSYPATEAIRTLSQIFLFDGANFDGRLQLIPRGGDAVFTVTEDDMLEDDEDIEQTKRADSISIPRVMNLNYWDVAGGLATDKQTSERAGDRRATGEMQLQSPVLMTADEAAAAVVTNHKVFIEDQRGELKFKLPDKFLGIVPSDCGFVQWNGQTVRARVVKCDTQEGYQEYTLVRDRQSAYTTEVEGYPASPQQLPASNVAGPTLLELLDIPILKDVDDGLGFSYYVAVAGASEAWQGATVELSYDGGANFVGERDVTTSVVMGRLTTTLADHPADIPDVTNTCQVTIQTEGGELEESDLAGMMNRANLAIIGDEIVAFAAADEVTPGVWELSDFLRGRKDTTTAAHAINERFVLLAGLVAIPASVTDYGREMTFRATSFGSAPETGTVKSMTYQGRSQTERRVGYLAARRDGTNAIVTWQGVGRLGGGATVAHGARFAGYRVTFSDGSSPETVVDTDDQTLTQDVSGFSSPVTISVQQLNDLTGAGPAVEVELA